MKILAFFVDFYHFSAIIEAETQKNYRKGGNEMSGYQEAKRMIQEADDVAVKEMYELLDRPETVEQLAIKHLLAIELERREYIKYNWETFEYEPGRREW